MRLSVAARSLKRWYFLKLGMSMMVPHNLSILSMTKVNIGQIGGKNSSIRGVVGSSSSMTLSAKHLSNLKSDNPTLLQGRRKQGDGEPPPPDFCRSVNPVSIRRCGGAYHLLDFAPPPWNFRPSYGPATDHDLHGLVIMSVEATEHSMYLWRNKQIY